MSRAGFGVPKDGRKLKPKYRNMKTLIERYCEAVEATGKEITIQLQDGLTEKLYNKVKAVANRYDIACHAGNYDILLKPSVKYIDGRKL